MSKSRSKHSQGASPSTSASPHAQAETDGTSSPTPAAGPTAETLGNTRTREMIRSSTEAEPQEAFDAGTQGAGDEVPFRTEMESTFQEDFSDVEAYKGQPGPMASMGAQAAARGDTVVFGEESPDKETVAHELTHVVQQRRAGEAAPAARSAVSNPADDAEREAESVASTVGSGGQAPQVNAAPTAGIHRGILDAIGDAFDLRENEEALDEWEDYQDAAEEYEQFVSQTYTSENFQSDTGLGGFDASYDPGSGTLTITCKCKFAFENGSATEFPDATEEQLAWTDEAKQQWVSDFLSTVSSSWTGGGAHVFHCQKDWWENLSATVAVEFVEVDSGEHFGVTITKIPSGEFKGSSVSAPDDGLFGFSSGQANLDSEDLSFANKPGGQQRGAVHEAGHMLGLDDEYEGLEGDVGHSDMVEEDWGHSVARGTDGRVMSGGEDIQPEHGVTYLAALRDATDMDEWGVSAKPARPVPSDPALEGMGDFPTPSGDTALA